MRQRAGREASAGPPTVAARRAAALPFTIMGVVGAVGGGLVAAATAYAPSFHASWVTAYLVLVVGVAQVALGLGQALLAAPERLPRRRTRALTFSSFNLGHACVVLGALLDLHGLTDLGGALLLPALGSMLWCVRPGVGSPDPTVESAVPGGTGSAGETLVGSGAGVASRAAHAATRNAPHASTSNALWLLAYRVLVFVLLVSIPTGLILARFSPG